jgi:two-component system, OmpR family, phosphate regulon response regulator OmpR
MMGVKLGQIMKKRHILVVDDDFFNSNALREHLSSQGFTVTVAENCREGKEVLSGKSLIDLIILDHLLPDGRGTDLLQAMSDSEALQKPPVIMSSSLVDPRNPAWEALVHRLPEIAQALIQAYVPKPYSFDNMDTVVDLIFEAAPPTIPNPKTLLSGDYRHPKK